MSDKMNLIKAVSVSQDNAFEMEDVSPLVQNVEVAPRLLTALFGGETNSLFLQTNTVKWDELGDTAFLPSGKAFQDFGPRMGKDKPRQLIYSVGSFGITGNVKPSDRSGRRVPGTNELMGPEYLVADMGIKAAKSWMLFEELAIAQLLTADTNITLAGPQAEYNFYTDIKGDTRGNLVAGSDANGRVTMNFAGSVDHIELLTNQVDLLEADLEKAQMSSSMTVCLCGKTFFAQRLDLERQVGLARDLRTTLDMQSMGVPVSSFGSGQYSFQYFDSPRDGIRYIRYAASILGTKMIADTHAYLVPVGTEGLMKMAYAPAQTEEFVNTVAQSSYAWQETHNRRGTTLATEKNVLPLYQHPELVRWLII